MDDNLLMYRGEQVSDSTLRELAGLGVDRVRLTVLWRNIAPAQRPAGFRADDPAAYPAASLDALDHAVTAARREGIEVLLTVTGGAPDWAAAGRLPSDTGSKPYDGDVAPNAAEFQRFVTMLGRRYGGGHQDENQDRAVLPRVGAWAIYNEPNQGAWLAPQWTRSRGGWVPASPRIYRGLVRAAIAGLQRAGHGRDTILLGETAPLGDRRPRPRSHMKPGLFLRELFCLDRRLKPMKRKLAGQRGCDFARSGRLEVTAYGHHPYSVATSPTRKTRDRDGITLADSARLKRILDAAARAGRVRRGLPIWYTEYGFQTRPPDLYTGVSPAQQATFIAQSERITRRDRRIRAITQFQLRDDMPQSEKYPPSDRRYWSTWQSGLRFADGTAKPALDAYRLPLTAVGNRLWGLVRPIGRGGPRGLRIQHRPVASQAWRDAGSATVDANGAFTLPASRGAGEYRMQWAGPGTNAPFTSPPTAVK